MSIADGVGGKLIMPWCGVEAVVVVKVVVVVKKERRDAPTATRVGMANRVSARDPRRRRAAPGFCFVL